MVPANWMLMGVHFVPATKNGEAATRLDRRRAPRENVAVAQQVRHHVPMTGTGVRSFACVSAEIIVNTTGLATVSTAVLGPRVVQRKSAAPAFGVNVTSACVIWESAVAEFAKIMVSANATTVMIRA